MICIMKSSILAVAALILVAGSGTCAFADSEAISPFPAPVLADKLVGTWDVTITPFDCSTRVAQAPFQSILSFGPGGTESETSDNPASPPSITTPAFGSWRVTGRHTAVMLTEGFVFAPASEGGTSVASVNHAITVLDETHFTDTAVISITNAAGAVSQGPCVSAAGTRFPTP